MSEEPRVCFVISPIGESGSEKRKNADILLEHIITPVVKEHGYKAVRADAISQAGDITIQIIEMLIQADLVVADLTGHNANVLYELAVRHAARKPVIHMIQEGQHPPFDIRQFRAISHDINNIVIAEQCKKELGEQVKYFDSGKPLTITNPIAIAVDIDLLRRSENLAERSYASLITSIQSLQEDVQSLYSGLDNAVADLHYRVEEVASSSQDDYSEPYIAVDMYVRALQAVVSSFNSLAEEAFKQKSSLSKPVLFKISNMQPYIRGLVFHSPLNEKTKEKVQSGIAHFFYEDPL
jgi:nucleoside 2-deoxyribosyltransferase